MLPQSIQIQIFLKKAFQMTRTSPQERGPRGTNGNKWPKMWRKGQKPLWCTTINLQPLSQFLFIQSQMVWRLAGGNVPSPESIQSGVSPSHPWHLESLTTYDFLFSVPRDVKQDARDLLYVVSDIPSVYTWSVYCSKSQTASVSTYSKWTDESMCVSILSITAGSRKFCLISRSVNISWSVWQ